GLRGGLNDQDGWTGCGHLSVRRSRTLLAARVGEPGIRTIRLSCAGEREVAIRRLLRGPAGVCARRSGLTPTRRIVRHHPGRDKWRCARLSELRHGGSRDRTE